MKKNGARLPLSTERGARASRDSARAKPPSSDMPKGDSGQQTMDKHKTRSVTRVVIV